METKKQPVFVSLLAPVLVCLYPCVFQYASNAPESSLVDALLFFGIFLAFAAVSYLIFLLLLRRSGGAGLLTSLAMLVFLNLGLLTRGIRHVLPSMRARYLLIVFGVILLALLVLLWRKKWRCAVPCILLSLAFGAISLMSLVTAAPRIYQEIRQNQARVSTETAASDSAAAAQGALPNVYYFLYDEYGGPENLDYYYGYDNSGFYDALEQRGFSCSMDSHNTESLATVRIVPHLFDLSYDVPPYFVSDDGASPRLYGIFKDMGYQINLINHNDFLDTDGTTVLSKKQHGDSICKYLYNNSALPSTFLAQYILRLPQLQTLTDAEAMVQNVLSTEEEAWQYTGGKPTVTLGYVACPHTQFLFDKDGNLQPEDEWDNWKDPQYYLGQLEYLNTRILTAVDEIQKHDPTAVIILQSDHGARTGIHRQQQYGDSYDEAKELLPEQNILNCVYLPGKTIDISGQTGINTLRTVLNTVYGTNYEMIPASEFIPDPDS